MLKRLAGWLREHNLSRPSFFDISVILFILILPIIHIPYLKNEMVRGVFFIHGTIFLVILSLAMRKKRDYRSLPLALLGLVGLFNLFRFSFGNQGEVATTWINWCLLNEGFAYIFFGALLIKTIVNYSKSYGWYYIPITLHIIGFILIRGFDLSANIPIPIKQKLGIYASGAGWSMTPIFAVLLAIFIMACLARKWKFVIPSFITALTIGILKWQYIWIKIWSRPDLYKAVIKRILHSKFLLGHGYYHILNAKDGFVVPEVTEFHHVLNRWGRGWRQSDPLEFTEYQGILALIFISWFFLSLLIKAKNRGLAYFYLLSGLLMCLFQRTMFFVEKGGMIAILSSLVILEILNQRGGNKWQRQFKEA